MDKIMGFIEAASWLPIVLVVLFVIAALYFAVLSRWKKAKPNEVLAVSGTKKGVRVYPGGGAFVSPFETHATFKTSVLDLNGDGKEAPTKPKVQVVVRWNAQVRPDSSSHEQLIRAYQDFYGEYKPEEIIRSLEKTLAGELRNVIGELTPEQLLHEKESFNTRVTDGATKRMKELGFELVNLNLEDVTDNNGYFSDMAAEELASKREAAANIQATTAKNVAVVQAKATQEARDAEITAQLVVDGRERDAGIERANNKAQRDKAEADAEVAGELQREIRNQELATRQGEVAVVRAEQDQKAAVAQREAELTRAETERQREVIEAQAEKDRSEINAQAKARQDEIDAEAKATVAKRNAEGAAQAEEARAKGVANAKRETASAEADAINLTADAEADKVRKTGLAAAEVKRAEGEAEAAAILAKGKAEAEAQKLMAEALAANDGANLRVTLAQIDSETQIRVATAHGEAFASVGEKATFIDLGGNSGGDGSDLLTRVLGNIPGMLTKLNVQSEALRGVPFGSDVAGLVNAIKGNAPAIAEAFGLDPSDVVEAVQALGQPAAEDQDLILVGDTTPEVDEVGDSQ